MSAPLRVAVVSRHELTRAGLAHLIGQDSDRAVVEFPASGPSPAPDVIVYDMAGAGTDLAELRHLVTSGRPVVALQPSSRADIAEAALAVGATCVVDTHVSGAAMIHVVEQAAAGRRTTASSVRTAVRDAARHRSGLTEREVAVLELIAAGLSNDEIASTLFITINTVKTYVRTAYRRIEVDSRSQAVIWALENGLGPSAANSEGGGGRSLAAAGPVG